jgi:hypothetical protein
MVTLQISSLLMIKLFNLADLYSVLLLIVQGDFIVIISCVHIQHFFLFLVGLGFELRLLAKQLIYHLSHTSSPFCSGYFGEVGSHELFTYAGF